MPWSPAPPTSTPCAMSELCFVRFTSIMHFSTSMSIPFPLYPIFLNTFLAISSALIFAFVIDYLVGTQLFLIGTAVVCVITEGISVYENLGELGVSLPFTKYFEKVKDNSEII